MKNSIMLIGAGKTDGIPNGFPALEKLAAEIH